MKLRGLGCEGVVLICVIIFMVAYGFYTFTGWIADIQGVHPTDM